MKYMNDVSELKRFSSNDVNNKH